MGGSNSISTFGNLTNKKVQEALKNQESSNFHRVGFNNAMSMQGSIMMPGAAQYVQASNNNNAQSIIATTAETIGVLNKFLGQVLPGSSSKSSSNNSTVSNVTANQQAAHSGLSQGVSGAGAYNSSSPRLSSVAADFNSYDVSELQNAIKNEIDPMVQNTNSNLNAAKADYNVLMGQKEQAKSDVSTLEAGIKNLSAESEKAKTSLDKDKSNLDSSIKAREQMDEQLSSLNEEYKGICEDVKNKESEKSKAQTQVSTCKSNVSAAEVSVKTTTAAYESAKNALDSTPETLPNGLPNPAYAAAKAACDNALKAKEQAEKELDAAQKELEAAEQQLAGAEENLTAAQNTKNEKLTELKNTEGECSKLAKACERNEKQVENAQKAYDTSLKNYDDTKNNLDKMNSELESAQGILTQCDEYEAKIGELETASKQAEALKAKAEEALQSKDANMANEVKEGVDNAKKEEIKKEISQHAAKSDGCSATKTPAENLLSMKNGSYGIKDKGEWVQTAMGSVETSKSFGVSIHNPVISADSSYFEEIGCIANSDGSFTNPENGETYVEVKSGTWVNTMSLGNVDSQYANEVDPEIRKAGIRGKEQGNPMEYLKLDKNTGRMALI